MAIRRLSEKNVGEYAKVVITPASGEQAKIVVGLGWDPERGAKTADIDSAAIVAGGGTHEVVYFHNQTHPSGCVVHNGDDLTGAGSQGGDDETIFVYPNKIPSDRDRVIFVIHIYDCYEKDQTLADVKNMHIRLYDFATNTTLAKYTVDAADRFDTAMVVAELYRDGDNWIFKPIGKGAQAADIHDLANEAVRKIQN